ncbi:MAG: hypothetical protein OXM54_12320 [Acidimicrobiaceae bacterium]|nr:hypothetical protein [Acidimicrobiaceae bacterium]MDE0319457.1 hypothetical protein [Acidimicrobiaceae bacterium]
MPSPSEIPHWCLSELSSYFSDGELFDDLNLTEEEAEYVVKNAIYAAPRESDRDAIRSRVRESLAEFRMH